MPAATVDHSQRICEVWACNLDEEMKKIRQVIRKYNYVAMVMHMTRSLKCFLQRGV
jgi:CCR4-NOT transcription complex subunit 7/8